MTESSKDNHQVDKVSCSSQDNSVPPSATLPSESSDNPQNYQATDTGSLDSTYSLQHFEDEKDDIRTAFTSFYRELTYLTKGPEEEHGKDYSLEYPKPAKLMIDDCYEMIKKLKSIERHQNLAINGNQGNDSHLEDSRSAIDQSDFTNMGLLDSITSWASDLEASLQLLIEERDSVISELKLLGPHLEELSPGIFATTEENIELSLVFKAVCKHLTESKSKESKLQQLEKENKKIGEDNLLLTKNNESLLSELQRLAKCLQEISPDFATSEENVLEKVVSGACKHLYESKHRESSVLQKLISAEGELSGVRKDCSRIEEENKKMSEDHVSHLNERKIRETSLLQKLKISAEKEANLLKEVRGLEGKHKNLTERLDTKEASFDNANEKFRRELLVEAHEVLDEIKNVVSNVQFPTEVLTKETLDKIRWLADEKSYLCGLEDDLRRKRKLVDEMAHPPVASTKNIGTQASSEELLIGGNKITAGVSQDHVSNGSAASIVLDIAEHNVNEIDKNVVVNDEVELSNGKTAAEENGSQQKEAGTTHLGLSNGKNEAEKRISIGKNEAEVVQASGSGTPHDRQPPALHPQRVSPPQPQTQPQPLTTYAGGSSYDRASFEKGKNYIYNEKGKNYIYNDASGHYHPTTLVWLPPLAYSMATRTAQYPDHDSSSVGVMPNVQHQQQSHPPQTAQYPAHDSSSGGVMANFQHQQQSHPIPPQIAQYQPYDNYYGGVMPNVQYQQQSHPIPPQIAQYQPYDNYYGGAMPNVQYQQQSHPPQGYLFFATLCSTDWDE